MNECFKIENSITGLIYISILCLIFVLVFVIIFSSSNNYLLNIAISVSYGLLLIIHILYSFKSNCDKPSSNDNYFSTSIKDIYSLVNSIPLVRVIAIVFTENNKPLAAIIFLNVIFLALSIIFYFLFTQFTSIIFLSISIINYILFIVKYNLHRTYKNLLYIQLSCIFGLFVISLLAIDKESYLYEISKVVIILINIILIIIFCIGKQRLDKLKKSAENNLTDKVNDILSTLSKQVSSADD